MIMTRSKAIRIGLLVLVGAGVILLITSERSRIALFHPDGFLTAREQFGVAVGEPIDEATSDLREANWQFVGVQFGGYCIRHRYPPTAKVVVYYDPSWRKTTLCIVEQDERVHSIQWHAAPFIPEL
jgi:hypothetical protein